MSDEKNVFDFHGLSDDAELDALLESVRRDIGEASPEPSRTQRPAPEQGRPSARTQPGCADGGENGTANAPRTGAQPPRREPHAQQIRQPRPNAARASVQSPERPAARRAAVAEEELPPQRERIRVVHPEDEKPERKKGRFGLAFGIYTAVLAVILIAACVVLWFYLDAYQATRPEQVMEEFSQLADEKYWADAVEGAFNVNETPFETRDELMDELCMDVLRSNDMVWREDDGYSADNMVYMVSAGGVDFCRVTIDEASENANAGFGFTYLEVTRVELLASFTAPQSHSITIVAPSDASVSVNGVALTEEYADSDAEIEVEGLPEIEANIADRLYTVYTVSGLYAPAEVSAVDAEGKMLGVEGDVDGDSVTFALGEGTLDYRILVPEGSTVTVNGVELESSNDTGDKVVPAFLEGFDNYGTLPELELWLVSGLHVEPEVAVTDADGEPLGDPVVNGTELAFFAEGDQTLEDAHSAEVRTFINAYLDYLSGEAVSDSDYAALQALVLDGSTLDTSLGALNADYSADGRTIKRVTVRSGSFLNIGATCYACTVDVKYTPTPIAGEDGEEVELPDEEMGYTVVFVMNGGVWLAASVVS